MKEDQRPRRIAPTLDQAPFQVECEADEAGILRVATKAAAFRGSQRIVLENEEQLWESVQVHFAKEDDGTLTVQILIFTPDRDRALQIAQLKSNPGDRSKGRKALEYDLTPKMLP